MKVQLYYFYIKNGVKSNYEATIKFVKAVFKKFPKNSFEKLLGQFCLPPKNGVHVLYNFSYI